MSEKDTGTPDKEVKTPEETVNDYEQEELEEESTDTVGNLHEDTPSKKEPESVPRARLNKEIERRKELEKTIEEMQKSVPKEEDLSEEDLSKLEKLEREFDQIKSKEAVAKFDAKFEEYLKSALEEAPEFKDVINPNVIKQMVKDPANKDKTYLQLLEEGYGNSVSGKRTTETTTPRGGAEDTKLDLERAQKDGDYRRNVVFKDPALKAQYNKDLETRINL